MYLSILFNCVWLNKNWKCWKKKNRVNDILHCVHCVPATDGALDVNLVIIRPSYVWIVMYKTVNACITPCMCNLWLPRLILTLCNFYLHWLKNLTSLHSSSPCIIIELLVLLLAWGEGVRRVADRMTWPPVETLKQV